MANTELNSSYGLNGSSNPVKLKVIVGYGQLAQTSVSIDGNPYKTELANEDGNYKGSFEITLGSNEDLTGKHLSVLPTVECIFTNELRTSVQIKLSGSDTPSDFPLLEANATSRGDVIDYSGEIDMVGA